MEHNRQGHRQNSKSKTQNSKLETQKEKLMSTEIALRPISDFAIFQKPVSEVVGLLQENLEGEDFTPQDLTRISVPGGGGQTFNVPSPGGDVEVKEIEGFIILPQTIRLYWEKEYGTGEVTPPDCYSNDGDLGVGNPGGACRLCSFNEWGSKSGGKKGKACQERRNLFFLEKDMKLPYLVSLPIKSIENYKKFIQHLCRIDVRKNNISVILGLEKAKNDAGIAYSKITFKVGQELANDEQKTILEGYRKAFSSIIKGSNSAPPPHSDEPSPFA